MIPVRATRRPRTFLAPGGGVVAVPHGPDLRVWSDGVGWTAVTTPVPPTDCALAPGGDRIAVAADGVVTVLDLPGGAPSAPMAVEGRPTKLALLGDVVAAVARRGPTSELSWWQVGDPERWGSLPLGEAVVWSLGLGDGWALVRGMRGSAAASGRGDPFANVVSLSGERSGEVVWDGSCVVSAPIGVAVVAGGSSVACHDGRDLQVWRLGGQVAEELVGVPAAEMAASPDGRLLALRRSSWESGGDVHTFSVVELATQRATEVGEVRDLGLHHELAVSDEGRLWVARTLPPDTISVLASGPGSSLVEEMVSTGPDQAPSQ